jgi:hypothetical protein
MLKDLSNSPLAGEPYWQAELKSSESVYSLLSKIMNGLPERPTVRAMRRHGVPLSLSFDAWFLRATAMRVEDRFERATVAIDALAQALELPRGPAPSMSDPSTSALAPIGAHGSPTPSQPDHEIDEPKVRIGGTSAPVVDNSTFRPGTLFTVPLLLIALAVISLGVVGGIALWRRTSVRTDVTGATSPSESATVLPTSLPRSDSPMTSASAEIERPLTSTSAMPPRSPEIPPVRPATLAASTTKVTPRAPMISTAEPSRRSIF